MSRPVDSFCPLYSVIGRNTVSHTYVQMVNGIIISLSPLLLEASEPMMDFRTFSDYVVWTDWRGVDVVYLRFYLTLCWRV